MLRAPLTTLATKSLHLLIQDPTLANLRLAGDISARVSCWNPARGDHCQDCQSLKAWDPPQVRDISRT